MSGQDRPQILAEIMEAGGYSKDDTKKRLDHLFELIYQSSKLS